MASQVAGGLLTRPARTFRPSDAVGSSQEQSAWMRCIPSRRAPSARSAAPCAGTHDDFRLLRPIRLLSSSISVNETRRAAATNASSITYGRPFRSVPLSVPRSSFIASASLRLRRPIRAVVAVPLGQHLELHRPSVVGSESAGQPVPIVPPPSPVFRHANRTRVPRPITRGRRSAVGAGRSGSRICILRE